MNVCLEFDHVISTRPLLITVELQTTKVQIDLRSRNAKLNLSYANDLNYQVAKLTLSCHDINIVRHPLTITNITLDNFYCSDNILYRGVSMYDQTFLHYAKKKEMYIDTEVNDCNRLDFTGTLCYTFNWPFFRNIFK